MYDKALKLPTLLLLLLTAGCLSSKDYQSDDSEVSTPMVLSNTPLAGETAVPLNRSVTATFSEEMDRDTLTGATFTLSVGDPAVLIPGTVLYTSLTATFWPSEYLVADSTYTATITTDAESALGVALAEEHAWSFTTGDVLEPGAPVTLGSAIDFAILAKSGVSTVPTSAIKGDIGVSPVAASYITGFSLTMDATDEFSRSLQVAGQVYAADYSPPTPSILTTAVNDMELAFTDAAARAADVTELGAGDVGGMTLAPGVYRWSSGLLIPTDLTLAGSATDVWIFQVAQDLTQSSGTSVLLSGGALPGQVFWQVAGAVEIGTTAHMEGVVLGQTSITMQTGASINGRLLAQTAVILDSSSVSEPVQ